MIQLISINNAIIVFRRNSEEWFIVPLLAERSEVGLEIGFGYGFFSGTGNILTEMDLKLLLVWLINPEMYVESLKGGAPLFVHFLNLLAHNLPKSY